MQQIQTPRVVIDPVVLTYVDSKLKILLCTRMADPEKGSLALPGGQAQLNQSLLYSIETALRLKAGVKMSALGYVDQLHTFDTVGLDPRGHAITVAHLCLGSDLYIKDTEHGPDLYDIECLPELAFDHIAIVRKAKERLADLSLKTTIVSKLLPDTFTMSDLHNLYEILLEKKLDRRNFRKKVLSLNIIEDTKKREQNVSNRPGHLYKFRTKNVSDLSNPLE